MKTFYEIIIVILAMLCLGLGIYVKTELEKIKRLLDLYTGLYKSKNRGK